MNKFITGVIAGATVSSAISMVTMNNQKDKKVHSEKTIGKTLHKLGDMADDMTR